MTTQQLDYLKQTNDMLNRIEALKPTQNFHIDSCSIITDWNKFISTHRSQINNDIVFSKGWNATAYRIKIIHDKILKNVQNNNL